MNGDRSYPAAVSGPFPTPPHRFDDEDSREIVVRVADDDREALVEMYEAFDSEDRAQGIPPVGEDSIRRWLERVFESDCLNTIAWHDDDPVGHAMLVPDEEGAHELAIFVLGSHQSAGIGTELLQTLLGYGKREGIERVWLTVERWNEPAIGLYQKVGFEIRNTESFELEMAIRIADSGDEADDVSTAEDDSADEN
ncbi:phosphinothricin acetyltransferase protein [Halorhabdus tiamatea SARL4B]|uniref:GCN5-related N-acetyltransferase n=1 Tax=Halorhabdus tiamatea SARL4B TaxID=1033806 RepID=F7PJ00_9EURY|nr:GNAT family N-acetyltransferase [Halorhabdus tiamatea]ERJ05898.1 phosphinothricin acetyltransferase protein [Halorhabdus tiamatea SARL4B]CCQ32966.1 GCN5-related N-acetyltransferase [Halorhabdus tiamatea SARL4B]